MRRVLLLSTLLSLALSGCERAPEGLRATPDGDGPLVRFDLLHRPLPEIPLPNDLATWPDPTSRTGLRLNPSLIAPTHIEGEARRRMGELEGWGSYAPITVSFDAADGRTDRPAVDLENLRVRHQDDDFEFANDAVYLVNLRTGVPVPLDFGSGSFQYVIRSKDRYFRNDHRRTAQNLLFETADETIDPLTGERDPERDHYDPRFDTDFDGVLDRPNFEDLEACPNRFQPMSDPDVSDAARDRCVTDNLLTWYERQTDTLFIRPLVPLEEKTEYAVVLTDRVLDSDGRPARSPFGAVHHPAQTAAMERLQGWLLDPKFQRYYGDIAGVGFDHVAFAWSYTTQPTVEDMIALRDGIYGEGAFAHLADSFPARAEALPPTGTVGLSEAQGGDAARFGPDCGDNADHPYSIDVDDLLDVLQTTGTVALGLDGVEADALVDSLRAVDHFAFFTVKAPFFLEGGPDGVDPNAAFKLDYVAGTGEVHEDEVQVMVAVPKTTAEHAQPFPVAHYGHGYGGNFFEQLGFAGHLARQGIASVSTNATFHEFVVADTERALVEGLFATACAVPLGDIITRGRGRDLDGDDVADSGGDYWTSYLFHTRDVVRQSVMDVLQVLRVLKSFDGERRSTQDFDGDGSPDLAGDFDGDGVVDLGGPDADYFAWGQSLGGMIAPAVGALDPDVRAAVPGSGGTLLDVGMRTFQGGAFEGIYLRNFGPLLVGVPGADVGEGDRIDATECAEDQVSVRFVVVDVNSERELEVACLDRGELSDAGGTVIIENADTGEVRCGRMDDAGRFRVGMPASRGDSLVVAVYDEPDVIDTYDGEVGCNPTSGANRTKVIRTFERDTSFQGQAFARGDELVAPVEGFGFARQTPELRRLMTLAFHVVDPGDPVQFMPYYGLREMPDPDGNRSPPTGLINLVTTGDQNVPLSAGVALGRAAGAVPFMRPEAAERYPELADYATPVALWEAFGDRTPNRVMIEERVLEGVARLERFPPEACGINLKNAADQPDGCSLDALTPEQCAMTLADVDVLDESLMLHGERELPVPLRLGRLARAVDVERAVADVDAVWAPRLGGVPYAPVAPLDVGGEEPLLAQLVGYTKPLGEHGFYVVNPCKNFEMERYLINLIARFFATGGTDLYYLSHPATHRCLAQGFDGAPCEFIEDVR